MMMDTSTKQMANWERLRNEARQTDQLIEQQLRRLESVALFDESKILNSDEASTPVNGSSSAAVSSPFLGASSSVHHHSGSSTNSPPAAQSIDDLEYQYRSADREIEESLGRLQQTIASMDDVCRELGPTSAAVRHTERFHGLLVEKQSTRRRLAAEFRQRKDRHELAVSRRAGDARRRGSGEDDGAGVRILMDEQTSIQHSLSRVNGLMEQAEGTRDRLRVQRERFNDMGDKLVLIAERIPFVKNVLHRIDVRRRREVVVLGSVMSSLMFIFFFFL
ncbi:golgi SNARE protein-like protein [Leptomonas pyrrhocoris]|uniref:Golgi SNARE protein-like protein n=1 Tax=Leptomonas pyrrhocoris TaxID=157538 RepID=A0A0N0DW78_LEPPY|nr:golgi SNARE protein-like protein [Leptomonas pyrrhocoris]XP_015659874.1 golgi SNARE protein-like protein [Leptomonas pyrrhocoris]KPA81434.1 golgi SNARE protein-like protein [Leptomonas pyrrhocoris]KPA81435.1 golgi SNARE protein-like protein [Leptomonas pyrrhocoris]|eukprot:XP_015659873.1 golgi SNARE protein-like protein [Leptomonas pyrrhocoris]